VKRIVVVFCVLLSLSAMAQDRIVMESGDTLKVVVADYDKKNVNYVAYDDPEFNPASLSTVRISKIIFDNGKVIDFQKSKYPGAFLGLAVGTAMPVSDFANTSFLEERSGFAKGGKPAIGLEGRYPVYKFIGVSAGLNVGAFGVDGESYFNQYNNVNGGSNKLNTSGNLSTLRFFALSGGPDVAFKLGSRLRFSIPFEIAFMNLKNKDKDQLITKNDKGLVLSTQTVSSDGNGLGFSTGLRIEFMVSSKIGLGLQMKASQFKVESNITNETTSSNNTHIVFKSTRTQNVSYVQFGLTARYHFK
jgi:hypothetical protein